ncbi:MAG: DUF1624 domain-containing protein [Phycisphaeraceae bacterium]|nr:DUF1624 domain-containing protein [Phycisphaeraceae bacterium]
MAKTPPRPRLDAIDQLRGLVMILMALDHARDYFAPFPHAPEDLSQASPTLFLTRWITHFCAPVFVFLAGTSIWLKQSRDQQRAGASPPRTDTTDAPITPAPPPPAGPSLSRYLLTRGLWLILLELTLIGASWGGVFIGLVILQVIWALGLSMLVMAVLVRLPWAASLAFGLATVLLHNLLDHITAADLAQTSQWLAIPWKILHEQGFVSFNPDATRPFTLPGILVQYPLIPWPGVMALGYCFGKVATMPAAPRLKWTAALGAACILAFLLLRAALTYGDPSPIDSNPPDHPILALLNTTKYPPSLQFLLMTLGPALLALVALERHRGPIADNLRTFGRVPLFFYLLHIPLIHISSAILWFALLGVTSGWQLGPPFPDGYTPQLWVAYAAWVAVVAFLWWPCRRYERVRTRHRAWWTTYL